MGDRLDEEQSRALAIVEHELNQQLYLHQHGEYIKRLVHGNVSSGRTGASVEEIRKDMWEYLNGDTFR